MKQEGATEDRLKTEQLGKDKGNLKARNARLRTIGGFFGPAGNQLVEAVLLGAQCAVVLELTRRAGQTLSGTDIDDLCFWADLEISLIQGLEMATRRPFPEPLRQECFLYQNKVHQLVKWDEEVDSAEVIPAPTGKVVLCWICSCVLPQPSPTGACPCCTVKGSAAVDAPPPIMSAHDIFLEQESILRGDFPQDETSQLINAEIAFKFTLGINRSLGKEAFPPVVWTNCIYMLHNEVKQVS